MLSICHDPASDELVFATMLLKLLMVVMCVSRRCLLEAYLRKLIVVPALLETKTLMGFLNSNHCENQDTKEEETPAEMPNDVEITDICIPSTRPMSDHVLYQIDVVNIKKRKSYSKWTVLKRFGQMWDLDVALRAEYASQPVFLESLPLFPERKVKVFADHMDDLFVEQRRYVTFRPCVQLCRSSGCLSVELLIGCVSCSCFRRILLFVFVS